VSDEDKTKLEGFIKKHSITYPIISARQAGRAYGIKAYPTEFTVDAHGCITSQNAASILGECDVPPALEYSKKFDKARAAIKAGDFKTAASELAKLEKSKDEKEASSATELKKWVDDHGTRAIADGDKQLASGDVIGAKLTWDEVSKKWDSKADCVKTAKEKIAELKKDADAKKALSQEKLYLQALALDEAGDKQSAVAAYEKCAKGAKDTPFAAFCEKKARELK